MFTTPMKKSAQYFFVILTVFFFSSCLEILEDIQVNNDGSGTFKTTLNLSQSKGQLLKIMSQDSINGHAIPQLSDVEAKLSELARELQQKNGISEVNYSFDPQNLILKLSFDFGTIDDLNAAIQQMIAAQNPKALTNPVTYSYQTNTFKRAFNQELLRQVNQEKHKVEGFISGMDNAQITSIFRFENDIANNNHPNAKLSSNHKNLFEQHKINALLSSTHLQSISIQTK